MATLTIEVAYVPAAGAALVLPLEVDAGTTLAQAIERSGLLQRCPEIDLARCGVGVFGEARGLDQPAGPGDRIEVYRPLPADPKELRRRRAARG